MKKIFMLSLLMSTITFSYAQSIIGSYTQSALIAPDKIRDAAQTNVKITPDKKLKNKIWISNLIGGSIFYAIASVSNEEKVMYSVPAQTIGGYAIKLGCVVFDKEENQIAIALNNKSNCFGVSQSDYGDVSVGKDGVKAGGITVGSNGEISTGSTKIGKKGVSVNAAKALSGLQYIGTKN